MDYKQINQHQTFKLISPFTKGSMIQDEAPFLPHIDELGPASPFQDFEFEGSEEDWKRQEDPAESFWDQETDAESLDDFESEEEEVEYWEEEDGFFEEEFEEDLSWEEEDEYELEEEGETLDFFDKEEQFDFLEEVVALKEFSLLERQTSGAKSADPSAAKTIYDQASKYFSMKFKLAYKLAIIGFYRVLIHKDYTKSKKNIASMLFNLGQCNYKLRRYATAAFYFEQAMVQKPGFSDTPGALQQAIRKIRSIPRKAGRSRRSKKRVQAKLKRLFYKGQRYYSRKRYTRALYYFARTRWGMINNKYSAASIASLTYNMSLVNYHLERYVAAISFMENYITNSGSDLANANRIINDAKFALGIEK